MDVNIKTTIANKFRNTPLGLLRIKKNLSILHYSDTETDNYLREIIVTTPLEDVETKGKNYYFKCTANNVMLTINSNTYTIITAKLIKSKPMNIIVKTEIDNIDWNLVSEILQSVGMAYYSPEKNKKAFESSYCKVFLYDHEKLVGFGRALSDGAYQAAIYDCAVITEYQGRGLGKLIVQEILKKLKGLNIILYASPGKEIFYEKLGFRRMKTGMAYFINRESMSERGFIE